jgi:hypothetical protein
MKKKGVIIISAILFALAGWNPAIGAEVDVSITNITHGAFFTPLFITAHGPAVRLFSAGAPASPELQAMAEGGDISGLSMMVGGADADTVENPQGGLLAPGAVAFTTINTDLTGNMYLSLAAMILPTNDGFVGLDSLPVPTEPGTYVYMLNAYDAGTEANNEITAADGGMPGVPGFPNPPPVGLTDTGGTGVTRVETNATVHIHRGILGDTDPMGGPSDIDKRIHRWLNPIARLILTVR